MASETGQERTAGVPRLPIDLDKLLKFENLVQSGGEAKYAIRSGQVRVNGAVETRRARKLVAGDLVEYGPYKIRIA